MNMKTVRVTVAQSMEDRRGEGKNIATKALRHEEKNSAVFLCAFASLWRKKSFFEKKNDRSIYSAP